MPNSEILDQVSQLLHNCTTDKEYSTAIALMARHGISADQLNDEPDRSLYWDANGEPTACHPIYGRNAYLINDRHGEGFE